MKKSPFLIILLVASMLLAQFAPATAAPVRSDRIPPVPASLDELVEYYGRLGDIEGPIGVVVEFPGTPAALVYAEAKESELSAQTLASITATQVDTIQNQQNSFASALKGKGIEARELFRAQRVYNGIWLYVDASQVAELAKMPGVKALHPIIPKELEHTTSVPLVGALQAWAGSGNYQGETISIGIIDTGIDYVHTNFGGGGNYAGQDFTTIGEPGSLFPAAKVVGGYDFVGDGYNAGGSGSQLVPVPDPDPMDCNGHGTHVAGTAAGLGVLTNGLTYTESLGDTYADLAALSSSAYISKFRIGPGVAPKADLYALRVFGCEGTTNVTEQAIEWAMDPNGDGNFSDHLDVINMSLGASFGSEFDTSAVASNNAAVAGVIVVVSAGNSGDLYYVTGSPSVAHRAISVANSMDSGAVVSAFELVSTAGTMLPGTYDAVEAGFGPTTFNVTGNLAYGTPANGCGASAPIAGVSGNIALVDRGACTFAEKYQNAVLGGATGVLVANNSAGAPFVMSGAPTGATTIPAMMTTLAIGNALKADLVAGAVSARLTTDYKNQFVFIDPSLEDVLTASSSRGIARVGNYLKPDIAAPGDTIFSAATGTGDEGVSLGGTSMAAPHVAGAMAILREQNPAWSVAELKALVMNTATEEITQGANLSTPSRVGAGRMVIPNALGSDVVAYNADNPAMVSVPFGVVKVVNEAIGVDQTLTKSVTVSNKGASPETYNLSFALRYQSNPGITFSLVDGSDNPLTSVTVPAGGTRTVVVKVQLDAAALTKTRDATISTASGRFFMAESGGLVVLTSTGSAPTLRVPVHISARPASEMEVQQTSLQLPAATAGNISLTPTGAPVDLAGDFSLATIFELLGESPNEAGSAGSQDSADLQHVGAMSNYGLPGVTTPMVYFGFSTYGDWDTIRSTEFDIYVDTDGDGDDDYVVYNTALAGTDAFVTVVVNLTTSVATASHYINSFTGATNTNAFNNNVVMLPVAASLLGLSASDTDFYFYVVTLHRDAPASPVDVTDLYLYDIAKRAFTTINPDLSNTPAWEDDAAYSPAFNIAYNKAYMNANTQGLLILHHHNAANTAEVVPFNQGSAIPSTWVGGVAVHADQPIVAVGRPHLGAEVASYVGQGAGNTTQYVPMLFKGAFGGGYNAALYIQNISNASASLTMEFINSSGATVHTKTDTLNSGASKGYWLPAEAGLPSGFAGGVKVTSTQNILAVGRPHVDGQIMTYNGVGMGSTTAWLPMFFKNGFGNYNTALYVQNVTGSSANLTIQYLNLDGTVACADNDTLAANASKGYWSLAVTCDTGSLPMGFVGGVKVTSTQDILAVGRAHLGAQITTYNGFDTGMPDAYVPMLFRRAFGGAYNAALYLQNVSGSSANVTIEYRDNAGLLAATQSVTLAAGAIGDIWLPGVAGLPDGFVGGARITSTQPVIAIGRPHLGAEITAYNGAPAMAGVAYLPMLFKNAFGIPYQSAFYIQNTGSSDANASIFFYDEAGALLCVEGIEMAANATLGFWSPTTFCVP